MLNCNMKFVHSLNGSAGVYHGESDYLQGLVGLDLGELCRRLSVPTSLYGLNDSNTEYLGVIVHLMQSVTTDDFEEHDNFSIEGEAHAVLSLLHKMGELLCPRREGDFTITSIDDFTDLLEEAKVKLRRNPRKIPEQLLLKLN